MYGCLDTGGGSTDPLTHRTPLSPTTTSCALVIKYCPFVFASCKQPYMAWVNCQAYHSVNKAANCHVQKPIETRKKSGAWGSTARLHTEPMSCLPTHLYPWKRQVTRCYILGHRYVAHFSWPECEKLCLSATSKPTVNGPWEACLECPFKPARWSVDWQII